jgi:hypothetical protein
MSIQYAGGTNIHALFSGVTKADMLANVLTNTIAAGWTLVNGITPSTVTITIATPGVVTLNSHGLAADTRIILNTTGALPTGLSTNFTYFVRNPTTNTFNLATTAGGANINTSGTQSGTHTLSSEIVIQTATTPQSYNLRCRFRDNASTGIQFSIESVDGVKVGVNDTTHGATLTPAAGKFWHIVANKYQFMCWVDGDFITGNEYMCVTCPYTFSFLTGTYLGVLVSGGRGAAAPQFFGHGNWRYTLYNTSGDFSANYFQVMYGSTLFDFNTNSGSGFFKGSLCFMPQLWSPNQTANSNTLIRRYGNGDALTLDPLLSWGLTALTDEAQIRCQLWDSVIVTDQFIGDITTSFDAHNWIAVTSSAQSSTFATLFVVTP